eukprot:12026455-Alexandrium_andersonii.AAC.1
MVAHDWIRQETVGMCGKRLPGRPPVGQIKQAAHQLSILASAGSCGSPSLRYLRQTDWCEEGMRENTRRACSMARAFIPIPPSSVLTD